MRVRRRHRWAARLTGVGLLLPGLAVAAATSPASAVITGNVMSGTMSSMWQTNGTVETTVLANGIVYAGGSFSAVRPPGTAASSSQAVARTNLAAFNATTGALVTTFDVRVDGKVKTLALSPDGTRLYIGGAFRNVAGVARNRVAAVSIPSGALVTGFNPSAGSTVNAIAATASTVYLGGAFSRVGNVGDSGLASVSAATGAVNPAFSVSLSKRPDLICNPSDFGCNPNGVVTYPAAPTALAVSGDGSTLLVGGNFVGTNGSTAGGMASLNATTGANRTWNANSVQPVNTSCVGRVTDIVIDGSTAFVTGEGDPPGCYEGTYSAALGDGTLNWNSSCLGASQAIAYLAGVLYKGSHEHDCSFNRGGTSGYVGGTSRDTFVHRHLLAQDATDGSAVHWSPNTNGAGSAPVGPHALAAGTLANGQRVIIAGGDFTRVTGTNQQGLARFVSGGDTATPAVPGRDVNGDPVGGGTPIAVAMHMPVTAQATKPNTLTVEFPAVEDADTGTLTYRIYRDGGSAAVATLTETSFPWSRPVLRFDDTGLAAGSTHSYRVSASDGSRTSAQSTAVSGTVQSGASTPFATAYANLSPQVWWRLGDTGSSAADGSGNGRTGAVQGGVTTGVAGAVSGNTAVTLNGSTGYVASSASLPTTNAFSEAAWFKTTSVTGGVIVAQSDTRTGAGGNTDRVIAMDHDGNLVFAMKAGASGPFGVGTINMRNQGPTWNDGKWHLVVGTYDGNGNAALYVDGWLQRTATGTPFDPTAKANGFSGNSYLRAGYADMSGMQLRFGINFYNNPWPLTEHFPGSLDEVTAYGSRLTAAQVAGMYAAGVNGGA